MSIFEHHGFQRTRRLGKNHRVTALVIQDILGGEIMKTETPDGWHYYNFINGVRRDFPESPFAEKLNYQNILSDRDEAFSDTNEEQYGTF
ncbi:YunG family protein [Brevibacillus fluminis]|uniref:YunG family protein n=1 Tax=Brevibacillus fluminis TaxID=511487 RepID=UPI003F8C3285